MLDKFQIVLHSSDPIAPVGVLHPLEYHLETKLVSRSDNDQSNDIFDSVFEVLGDGQAIIERPCQKLVVSDSTVDPKQVLYISKSEKADTFSITCWLQDASKTSPGMR